MNVKATMQEIIDEINENRKKIRNQVEGNLLNENIKTLDNQETFKPITDKISEISIQPLNTETNLNAIDSGIDENVLYEYGLPKVSKLNDDIEETLKITQNVLQILGPSVRKNVKKISEDEKEIIRYKIDCLKKYNNRIKIKKNINKTMIGQGVSSIKLFKNDNEVVERLNLVCGEISAGNTSNEVKNEFVDLIDYLLKQNILNKVEYKTLWMNYGEL